MPSFPLTDPGLSAEDFPPIAFVDVDGTLFKPGTDEWMDGVKEKFIALSKKYRICTFTARGPGRWMNVISEVLGDGFMHITKPLGVSYALFDDRLGEADQCLP